MKRFIAILISMLTMTLVCTLNVNAANYDKIKVGLFYGSTAKSSVTISVDDAISYGNFTDYTHVEEGQLQGSEFTFRALSPDQIIVNETLVIETSELSIAPVAGSVGVGGKEYRGSIILSVNSANALTVINVVSLEEYLYGVVPNEVPASWKDDALKAQAVCARGFAVSNINKHASLGFNVCASTNCQVYGGLSTEHPSSTKAVDDTKGQVVTYNGSPIESLFYSSSGGHTANAKNVWGSSISYLSGVEDPYEPKDSPRHSWSATLTLDEIKECLSSSKIDVGDVVKLEAKTDETGRTYELKITGTEGTHTLTKTGTCAPFVSKGVISQKFTISPISSQGGALYGTTSHGKEALSGRTVISGFGSKKALGDSFHIRNAYSTTQYANESPDGYVFTGGGWGHGVGLSQYGAKGMADAGFDYDEILMHYYPGTELETIY